MTKAFTSACGKEARALLLPWLAAAAAVTAAALFTGPSLVPAAITFTGGAIAIGSWTIGHEYSGRTLPLLLTQPVSRPLLWLSKLGVAAALLLALGAVSAFVLGRGLADADEAGVLALPVLAALTIAPVLTMLCRSPLAGTVFTAGILATAWASGTALSAFGYGPSAYAPIAFAAFRLTIISRVIVLLSPIAAIANWLMFMRLEAVDGGERHVSLTGWLGTLWRPAVADLARPTVNRRPLWQLTKKELQLQQMTVVVAVLYVLLWAANELVTRQNPQTWLLPMGMVTALYSAMLALLAGSVASADERQLGTLDWQLLQPVASRTQWMVKAGTALGLTTSLGLALPMALALGSRSTNDLRFAPMAAIVPGLCLIGLYVSSFTSNGVRALITSVLTVSVMAIALAAATRQLSALVFGRMPVFVVSQADWQWLADHGSPVRFLQWVRPLLLALMGACFVILLWRKALANFRSGDRQSRQVLWLAAGIMLAACVFTVVDSAVNSYASNTIREQIRREKDR